jgi:DNA-binding HxlR family transcriptional regulator
MIFTDIQNTLHLTPGNLDSHLKHLKKDGHIRIKKILSKEGPRTAIYMTEQGDDELKRYLSKLRVGLSV